MKSKCMTRNPYSIADCSYLCLWCTYTSMHVRVGWLLPLECYFGVYFPRCCATREINTKITLSWVHKQFATRVHTLISIYHHCGQTLTIDHMLLECALVQQCRDEYYTVDSLNALFETIPETCIVEFLREAGFFHLIWCNLLTSTSPQTCTIWSDLSNYLVNESNPETHLLV